MNTRKLRLWMLTLYLVQSSLGQAMAQIGLAETAVPGSVPTGISYQGRLEESGVVVTGSKDMRFRLFDLATGGFALYDSGVQSVGVSGGVFSVVLPIPLGALAGGTTRYIEIEVEGTVLTPRDPLTSVPYAKVAEAIEGDIEISTGGFHVTNPAGSVLFVSSVNAQIGIGTSNPAPGARLHVLGGDVVIGSTDTLGGGTSNEDLFVEGNVIVDGAVSFAGGSFGDLAVATTSIVDAGQKFKVGAGTFTVMESGNVGLGTTSPAVTLDIQAVTAPGVVLNHATQPQLRLDRAGFSQLVVDHDGTLGRLGTVNAADLALLANNSERLRLAVGGNIGVATTNPTRLLDVAGTLRATNLETSAAGSQGAPSVIIGGDADTGLFLAAADTLAATTGGGERLRIDAAGNVGIGGAAAAGQRLFVNGGDVVIGAPVIAGGSAQEDLFIEGNLIVDGQSILQSAQFTDLAISTGNSAGQLFKVGAGTFTVLQNGNVGIGTTSPGASLDVQAATLPALAANHATNPRLQLRRAGVDVVVVEHDGTNGTVGTQSATDLELQTNNTTRIYVIDATGRVGISSAAPTATLSVGGNANVQGALTLGTPLGINLGGTGQTTAAAARTALGAVDRAGTEATVDSLWPIRISSTAAEAARLENDPVNCTVPGEFAKGVDAQGVPTCVNVAVNEEGTIEALIYDNDNTLGGPWTVAASGTNDIAFDGGTFAVDVSLDRVGIGTTSPGHKLDVQGGNINASGKLKEGGNDLIPSGTVMYFNLASCPTGWSSYANGLGRVIVGLPAAGTLEGTVGAALTNLQTLSHSHDLQNHTHSVDPDGAGHSHGLNSHTHTVALGSHQHDMGNHTHNTALGNHNHSLNNHTHDFDPAGTATGGPSATNTVGVGAGTVADDVHTHTIDIPNTTSTAAGGNTGNADLGTPTSTTPSTNLTSNTDLGTPTTGGAAGNTATFNLGAVGSSAPSTNATNAQGHTMPYIQLTVCEKS